MANNNNVGGLFASLFLDTEGFKTSLNGLKDTMKGFEGQMNTMGITGALSLGALSVAVKNVSGEFGRAQGVSQQFDRNFQDSASAVRLFQQAVKGTIDDTNLMANANHLTAMGVAKDENQIAALFALAGAKSREFGISTQEALDTITTGVDRLAPRALAGLGIAIPDALKKTMSSMDEASQRQALLNYVLSSGDSEIQNYINSQKTLSESMASSKAATDQLNEALGGALAPTVTQISIALSTLINMTTSFVNQNGSMVRGIVTTVGTVIIGITAFAGLYKAIQGVIAITVMLTTTVGIASLALGALIALFIYAAYQVSKNNGGLGSMNELFKSVTNNATKASGAIGAGADANAQKLRQVADAIKTENEAYQQQLADLVRTKQDEIASSKSALANEEADFKASQDKRNSDYKTKTDDLKKQNAQRIADLEASMGKSLIIGSSTYDKDKQAFLDAIENEKTANQTKLDEAQKAFDSETIAAQKACDEKTNALKKTIEKDEALLLKHSDVIKGINLSEANDEIDNIVKVHEKKLADLNQQQKEVSIATTNMGKMFSGITSGIKPVDWGAVMKLPSLTDIMNQMGKMILELPVRAMSKVFLAVGNAMETLFPGHGFAKTGTTLANDIVQSLYVKSGKSSWATGTSYANGGISLVGENGPELVRLPTGSQVLPTGNTKKEMENNNKNVEINNTIYQGVDTDTFTRQLAFQLRTY